MKIVLEVSSRKRLMEEYGDLVNALVKQEDCSVVEDKVGYGTDEVLVMGVLFIIETIKSGLTYDLIKDFMVKSGKKILDIHYGVSRRPENEIVFYLEGVQKGRRYKLDVHTEQGILEVTLPDGSRIEVKVQNQESGASKQ